MKISGIEGIVLKSFKYQNSSLIGEIYTADYGLRTFIIKGLSSNKNTYKSIVFRPPQIVNFTAYLKNTKEINLLTDIEAKYMYKNIPSNVRKGTIALFYVEMFRNVVFDGDVHNDLYKYFKQTLIDLDTLHFRSIHIIIFLHRLSQLIGIGLTLSEKQSGKYFDLLNAEFTDKIPRHSYSLNESDTAVLLKFLEHNGSNADFTGREQKLLFKIFIQYYKLQIDSFTGLNSPEIINKVLIS